MSQVRRRIQRGKIGRAIPARSPYITPEMHYRMQARTEVALLKALLLLVAVAGLLASFNPEWHLWGLDSSRVFPIWLRVTLVLTLIVAILPVRFNPVTPLLERLTGNGNRGPARLAVLLLLLSYLAAAFLFFSENHILGDGQTLLHNIENGMWFSATEPFDYLAHQLANVIIPLSENSALWSYRMVSLIASTLFLLTIATVSRERPLLVTIVAAGLTFAAVQFFFGYVESYTLSFLFSFLYLLSADRDLRSRRISWRTIVALLLALGFHLSSVVLLPSLVFLISNRFRSRRSAWIATVVSVLILLVGVLFAGKSIDITQITVPLLPTEQNPYSLLSVQHLTDLLNIMLLDYPLLPLLLFVLLFNRELSARWFYLTALLPALLFVIIIDPKIGAMRDWDLLAVATAPALVALIGLINFWYQQDRTLIYSICMPLLLFALLSSGSWILLNSSSDAAYPYTREVIRRDVHYSASYYQGYRNKSWGTLVSELHQDYGEAVRAQLIRLRAAPDDYVNRYNLAMHYFFHMDRIEDAATLVEDHWHYYTDDPLRTLNVAGVFRESGRVQKEGKVLEDFITRGRLDHLVFLNYARWLAQQDRIDRARGMYSAALDLWETPPVVVRAEFCLFLMEFGPAEMAVSCLKDLRSVADPDKAAMVDTILLSLQQGEKSTADSLAVELIHRL